MAHTGSCLCGGVRIEIGAPLRAPDACHCTQCRKQSGHYWVSTNVARSDLTVHGADKVVWRQSSERVRRGFCGTCGSFLFWDPIGKDFVAVAMGALDLPTETHLELHIFVSEKGDYYDIADGVPQRQR